jgi:hypothetical protein
MRLSPLGTSATNWPIVPAPDDRWWTWSSRWNENWQGKRKYSEPAPVPLCPPQMPHDLTRARTWAAAVGSRRQIAWAVARPRGGVTQSTKQQKQVTNRPWRWRRYVPPKYAVLSYMALQPREDHAVHVAHSPVGLLHCWVIILKLARSQNCTGLLNEENSQYKASLCTVVTNL